MKKIDFGRQFDKNYKKASRKIKNRFDERLTIFIKDQNNVLLKNHALVGKWKGCRSINITGDWRAIYIERESRIIFVALGTHSQLYG